MSKTPTLRLGLIVDNKRLNVVETLLHRIEEFIINETSCG